MISKYRFMENHLLQRQNGLLSKIPEIQKSLDLVNFLSSKRHADEPMITDFEISDTMWVKAKIPPTETVNLWLGANVMLEYPIDEAKELLDSKLKSAKTSQVQVREDLEYLKEQITTMEVNMARVYNDEVKSRREKKA
ncbi:Prefoldin alpha-like protein [Globomyces pollinis-pini]|nr:Prefoldin alpha-like protein [Globomyces pollinis-pini]